MEKQNLYIGEVPAIIWGPPCPKIYLYVRGQGGNKEEGALFAEIAARHGYQILSIDLPAHGSKAEAPCLGAVERYPEIDGHYGVLQAALGEPFAVCKQHRRVV